MDPSTKDPLAHRRDLARRRLFNILRRHTVATARTLEQKISDAGPYNQRIHPHILTTERNCLIQQGRIKRKKQQGLYWFYLADTPVADLKERLAQQAAVAKDLRSISLMIGQALEIAIYKALLKQAELEFLGRFKDLDQHDDSTLYRKEEPPQSLSGLSLEGDQNLDFLVRHRDAGWAALEAKNVREWLYPDRQEIKKLLQKAIALDCIPVLIGRRVPYVTFKIFHPCGVVFHQMYNQLLPSFAREIAEKARDKHLLGYHDIRVGNDPDDRLLKFIGTNLPAVLPDARDRFENYKDLIIEFAHDEMSYEEFSARARRREAGTNEDFDPDDYLT